MIYSLLGRIEIQAFPHITSVLFDPNGANYRIFLCVYPMPAGAAPWQLQKEARIDMQLHPHRGAVVLRARPCPLSRVYTRQLNRHPSGYRFNSMMPLYTQVTKRSLTTRGTTDEL